MFTLLFLADKVMDERERENSRKWPNFDRFEKLFDVNPLCVKLVDRIRVEPVQEQLYIMSSCNCRWVQRQMLSGGRPQQQND